MEKETKNRKERRKELQKEKNEMISKEELSKVILKNNLKDCKTFEMYIEFENKPRYYYTPEIHKYDEEIENPVSFVIFNSNLTIKLMSNGNSFTKIFKDIENPKGLIKNISYVYNECYYPDFTTLFFASHTYITDAKNVESILERLKKSKFNCVNSQPRLMSRYNNEKIIVPHTYYTDVYIITKKECESSNVFVITVDEDD